MINIFAEGLSDETITKTKIIVITGHFGAGKTNVSINLAAYLARNGRKVTLIDYDTVNPYFRAADNREMLTDMGVRCIVPVYANTNVDIPAIPPEVYSVFCGEGTAIFDVGGDDTGATAIGSLSSYIIKNGYAMLYVANKYRQLTDTPEGAAEVLREIEHRSRLTCTGIVNNSNLGAESTPELFSDSFAYADSLCRLTSLPLAFETTTLEADFSGRNIFHIKDITKKIYGLPNTERKFEK